MGVVIWRWVWLEWIGVVSGCCYKEARTVCRFPHNYYLSLLQQHPYFFVHFLNVFSFLFVLFLCNIANVAQRIFEIVQKLRSC